MCHVRANFHLLYEPPVATPRLSCRVCVNPARWCFAVESIPVCARGGPIMSPYSAETRRQPAATPRNRPDQHAASSWPTRFRYAAAVRGKRHQSCLLWRNTLASSPCPGKQKRSCRLAVTIFWCCCCYYYYVKIRSHYTSGTQEVLRYRDLFLNHLSRNPVTSTSIFFFIPKYDQISNQYLCYFCVQLYYRCVNIHLLIILLHKLTFII